MSMKSILLYTIIYNNVYNKVYNKVNNVIILNFTMTANSD